MKSQDWSDIIDNSGGDSCQFLFTAASLKGFIKLHCKDGWAAARDIPTFVQAVKQTSDETLQSDIFRPLPRSLSFPLLRLPNELIREIARKCETNEIPPISPEIHNLSYTSKSIRDLVLWFVFHRFHLRRKQKNEPILSESNRIGIDHYDLLGLPKPLDLHMIDEIRFFETITILPDRVRAHSISQWFEAVFNCLGKAEQPLRHLHLMLNIKGSKSNIPINEEDRKWTQRYSRAIAQFQNLESFTYSSWIQTLPESWHNSLIVPMLIQSLPSSLKSLELIHSGLTTESWTELQRFNSLRVLKVPGSGIAPTPMNWNTNLEKLVVVSQPGSFLSVPTVLDLFQAAARTIRTIQIKGGQWPSSELGMHNTTFPIPFQQLSHVDLDSMKLEWNPLLELLSIFSKSSVKTMSFRKTFKWTIERQKDIALSAWNIVANEYMGRRKWKNLRALFHDHNELYIPDELSENLRITEIELIKE